MSALRRPASGRRGATLVELVAALAVLAVAAGVTGLALGALDRPAPPTDVERVAEARREALSARRPVTLVLEGKDGPRAVTALPDGRVLGADSLGLDPLTGRPRAAR